VLLDRGRASGYEEQAAAMSISEIQARVWNISSLQAETLVIGTGEGRLLGGAKTLVQHFVTPWDWDTIGAILISKIAG